MRAIINYLTIGVGTLCLIGSILLQATVGVSSGVFAAASQAVAQDVEEDVDWEAYSEDLTIYDINSDGVRLPDEESVDEIASLGDDDGAGDVHDNDDDNIADSLDACAMTEAGEAVEPTECSINNLCPCESGWTNHDAYVRCVTHASENLVTVGSITEVEKDTNVSMASTSSCGANK